MGPRRAQPRRIEPAHAAPEEPVEREKERVSLRFVPPDLPDAPARETVAAKRRRRRGGARHRRDGERGATALEVAIATPVVLLLLIAGATLLSVLVARLKVVDATGAAVRAAARGEQLPDLGKDAEVVIVHDGDLVRVTVRQRVSGGPLLAGFFIEEKATAMAEPSTAAAP
ncbi:hypothetical protein [Dactylosporangium sp. CA-233914]|uniref:hypothetical protein n=1 Tax=Dactylosporangium sp. CA-233914 TaxID=3239934 RepID=UPI003D9462A1